jgi:hypothetical protein
LLAKSAENLIHQGAVLLQQDTSGRVDAAGIKIGNLGMQGRKGIVRGEEARDPGPQVAVQPGGVTHVVGGAVPVLLQQGPQLVASDPKEHRL